MLYPIHLMVFSNDFPSRVELGDQAILFGGGCIFIIEGIFSALFNSVSKGVSRR